MSQPMPETGQYASGVCYRHPSRQSFVLCQRCGRTICGECQTPAAVGVICPECMREQRASYPSGPSAATKTSRRFAAFNRSNAPVMTYAIIAVCVGVYILQFITGGTGGVVTTALQYAGVYSLPTGTVPGFGFEPWRLLTSVFAHVSIIHIGFNMYTLWIFGQILEPLLGKWRYLALFLITGIAGSAAMLVLSPFTAAIGASGAIFGMMGGLVVVQRKLGGQTRQLWVLIVLNLALAFVPGLGTNIAWQAHVGGLIGGLLTGLVLTETRQRSRRRLQVWLLIALAVLFVGIGIYPVLFPGLPVG